MTIARWKQDEGARETHDSKLAAIHTAAAKQKLRSLRVTLIHRQSSSRLFWQQLRIVHAVNWNPAGVDLTHEKCLKSENIGPPWWHRQGVVKQCCACEVGISGRR